MQEVVEVDLRKDKTCEPSEDQLFLCDGCYFSYTNQKSLNEHMCRIDSFSLCTVCSNTFPNKCSLKIHSILVHNTLADGNPAQPVADSFQNNLQGTLHEKVNTSMYGNLVQPESDKFPNILHDTHQQIFNNTLMEDRPVQPVSDEYQNILLDTYQDIVHDILRDDNLVQPVPDEFQYILQAPQSPIVHNTMMDDNPVQTVPGTCHNMLQDPHRPKRSESLADPVQKLPDGYQIILQDTRCSGDHNAMVDDDDDCRDQCSDELQAELNHKTHCVQAAKLDHLYFKTPRKRIRRSFHDQCSERTIGWNKLRKDVYGAKLVKPKPPIPVKPCSVVLEKLPPNLESTIDDDKNEPSGTQSALYNQSRGAIIQLTYAFRRGSWGSCQECFTVFNDEQAIYEHECSKGDIEANTTSADQQLYVPKLLVSRDGFCEECDFEFPENSTPKHRCIKKYKCDTCQMEFTSLDALKSHEDVCLKLMFYCSSCNKQCASSKHFANHNKKVHRVALELPWSCEHCCESFSHRTSLEAHERTIHFENFKFNCRLCDYPCITSNKSTLHATKHSRYSRHRCECHGFFFNSFIEYKFHLKTQQGALLNWNTCGDCEKEFLNSRMMDNHHCRKRNANILCHLCPKKHKSSTELKRHMAHHHEMKPYLCSMCPKIFYSEGARKHHENTTHAKERPFLCDRCAVSFKTGPELLIHLRIHGTNKPFKCDLCDGATFRDRISLGTHYLKHEGRRPFQCNVCGNAYFTKKSLKKHMYKKHVPIFKIDQYNRILWALAK